MSAIDPVEKRLRNLYLSPKANKRNTRLEIAHIFRQTNFGLGNEGKSDLQNNIYRHQITQVFDDRALFAS